MSQTKEHTGGRMSTKRDQSWLTFALLIFVLPVTLVILAPGIADALNAVDRTLFGSIDPETGEPRINVGDAGVIFIGMWFLLVATSFVAENGGRAQGYREGRAMADSELIAETERELSQAENRERQAREAKERREERIVELRRESRELERRLQEIHGEILRSTERKDYRWPS